VVAAGATATLKRPSRSAIVVATVAPAPDTTTTRASARRAPVWSLTVPETTASLFWAASADGHVQTSKRIAVAALARRCPISVGCIPPMVKAHADGRRCASNRWVHRGRGRLAMASEQINSSCVTRSIGFGSAAVSARRPRPHAWSGRHDPRPRPKDLESDSTESAPQPTTHPGQRTGHWTHAAPSVRSRHPSMFGPPGGD
jgi:hypothetical protein